MLDEQGNAELLAPAAARAADVADGDRRAAVELPATFYAFDLIAFEDFDLRPLPLTRAQGAARRSRAQARRGSRSSITSRREGEAFLAQVTAMGLEGIIAKKADAPYRGGRSSTVAQDQGGANRRLRHRRLHQAEGQSRRTSARCSSPTGSNGTLVYAGRVGTDSTTRCSRSSRRCSSRSCDGDAAVHRPGVRRRRRAAAERADSRDDDDDVGRAVHVCEVPLPRVHARRTAASRDVPAAAGRQARARVRAAGREQSGSGEARTREAELREARRGRRNRGDAGNAKRDAGPTRAAAARAAVEKNDRVLQPQQDLLARREVHQGRSDRLLPRGRASGCCRISRTARWC